MGQVVVGVLAGAVAVAAVAALIAFRRARRALREAAEANARLELIRDVEARYRHVLDLEAAIAALAAQRESARRTLEAEHQQYLDHRLALGADIERLQRELGQLTDEQTCADSGLYTP